MDPLLWVVLPFTALCGFFSLADISLRSFRRVELQEALGGVSGEAKLERFEAHLPALRLSISLCRALANLVLVVLLLYLLGAPGGGWARTVAATAAAAAIIAIVGLAIPHAWAAYAGEKFLAAVLPVLFACRYALYPVISLMQSFDVPIRRLSGTPDEDGENGDNAKKEILYAAEEGRAEGAVDDEEAEMIESVMELSDTHAGEIMTPRTDIFALPVETAWQRACQSVSEAGHSRVPVYDGDIDNITGILYAKDLLERVQGDEPADLRSLMRKCYFVPESKPLNDMLREFKARKVHIAVVLDEYGGTAGLITIEDVLEEIVGDISDEYDRPEPAPIRRLDDKSVEVEGRTYIDDLNDALGIEIPEDEDYDTVAGFVFSAMGYIPAVGEALEDHRVKFTVLDADERKITRLRVERIDSKGEAEEH